MPKIKNNYRELYKTAGNLLTQGGKRNTALALELIGQAAEQRFAEVANRVYRLAKAGRLERVTVNLALHGLNGRLTPAAETRIDRSMWKAEVALFSSYRGRKVSSRTQYVPGDKNSPASVRCVFKPVKPDGALALA